MEYIKFCYLLDSTKQNRLNDPKHDELHDEILMDENFKSPNVDLIDSEYTICGWFNSLYYNKEKDYYFYVCTTEKRF